VTYTWSKSIDDSSQADDNVTWLGSFSSLQDPNKPWLERSLSTFDIPHVIQFSYSYDLPFGKGRKFGSNWSGATNAVLGNWQLDLIEHATSGFPLFVVDSGDGSGVFFSYNGGTFQRPNQVGDPNKGGDQGGQTGCPTQVHTIQHWFNPCAFAQAPAGKLGTAARAPVYGPRFVNTDFSIIKDFPLTFREGTDLQFRAEFFNLFNHPQFYLGGAGGSGEQDINASSTFGVINNTVNNARLIQFGLKLRF